MIWSGIDEKPTGLFNGQTTVFSIFIVSAIIHWFYLGICLKSISIDGDGN